MDRIRYHLIDNGSDTVIFFCDDLSILKVQNDEIERYKDVLDGNRTNADKEWYKTIQHTILNNISDINDVSEDDFDFSTLILHISNDCNMRCEYCFASHGLYKSKKGLMSKETAIKTLELFYKKYKSIREIKFFGGEPLLNAVVIETVCQKVTEMYKCGLISAMPRFKIITNGTILSDRIIQMVKKYSVQVVFSIDGPDFIHDEQRYFEEKKPSYSMVMNNFKRLQKETQMKQPCSVEITYTQKHLNNGFDMARLAEYFYKEMNIPIGRINISLVYLDKSSPLALTSSEHILKDYVLKIVNNQKEMGEFLGDLKIQRLLFCLKNRKKHADYICPAGESWAAVSSTGDIYPCLMFTDNHEFYMGNIEMGENFFDSQSYKKIRKCFQNSYILSKESCQNCFANNLCSQCAGINYFQTGDISKSNESFCDSMRLVSEVLICAVADGLF